MEPRTRTADVRTLCVLSLLLVVAILAVYGQVVTHDFVGFDDPLWITENEQVLRGLTLDGVGWAFTTATDGNWVPLTWLSHMAMVDVFGPEPAAHLAANVLIHATTSVLLLLVFHRMTGRIWPSAMVAALFGLHPLHVESVAWATERKDVLYGLFWVLTMGAYAWYVARPSVARYAAVAALLLLGLLSKPMIVTLPFVLLLLDRWPLERMATEKGDGLSLRWLALEKVPLLAMAFGVSLATYLAQGTVGSIDAAGAAPVGARVLSALAAYGVYIRQTFWPFGLSVFYPRLPSDALISYAAFGAFMIILGLGVSAWMLRRRPYVGVGWLWFLGTLAPVIGFVQIGFHGHADRYTYVPHVGLFIILAWAAAELVQRRRRLRAAVSILSFLVLVGFSIRTWDQVGYWKDDKTLFGHALETTTDNDVAHNMYGSALLEEGDLIQAAHHFGKAVEIDPVRVIYYYNLGLTQALLGEDEDAKDTFYSALQLDPEYGPTRFRLGNLLLRNGRLAAAAGQYTEFVALEPDDVSGRINLGLTLARLEKRDAAEVHFLQALRLDPASASAHYNYALLLIQKQSIDEAIEHLGLAVESRPDHVETHRQLGVLLGQIGEPDAAREHMERASQLEEDMSKSDLVEDEF